VGCLEWRRPRGPGGDSNPATNRPDRRCLCEEAAQAGSLTIRRHPRKSAPRRGQNRFGSSFSLKTINFSRAVSPLWIPCACEGHRRGRTPVGLDPLRTAPPRSAQHAPHRLKGLNRREIEATTLARSPKGALADRHGSRAAFACRPIRPRAGGSTAARAAAPQRWHRSAIGRGSQDTAHASQTSQNSRDQRFGQTWNVIKH